MPRISFNVDNRQKDCADFSFDENLVKKILSLLINDEKVFNNSCLYGKKYEELCIDFVICDDEFIHKVNSEYREIDKPTDVISFALYSDDLVKIDAPQINLGEIIISLDTAKKQAKEAAHSLKKEVYYLISHGILHLLGFDHQTVEEYNFMVEVQNKVIAELGI